MSPTRSTTKENRFCLPLIKESKQELLKIIKENSTKFRYLEVWLDYLPDLDPSFVTSLVGNFPNQLVFVFRRQKSEAMKMTFEKRYEIIKALSRKPAYVDLDITIQTDEITRLLADRLAVKTILSYHNYNLTPSDTQLRTYASRMQGWKAHICKFSTYCKNQRDSLRLLELLIDLREAGQKCIVLGMGSHGAITRVFGTKWGNEMVFTPKTLDEKSAPGQLTRDRLDTILQALA